MDDLRIKTAAELISAIISPQAAEAAGTWAKVLGVWPRLAGERAAAHSRITDLANRIVLVEVDHPGWIQLLHFRQTVLLKELQRCFPALEIRGIQFRVSRMGGAESSGAGEPPPVAAEAVGEEERQPEPSAPLRVDPAAIQDPALRDALAGLRDALEGGREEDPAQERAPDIR